MLTLVRLDLPDKDAEALRFVDVLDDGSGVDESGLIVGKASKSRTASMVALASFFAAANLVFCCLSLHSLSTAEQKTSSRLRGTGCLV